MESKVVWKPAGQLTIVTDKAGSRQLRDLIDIAAIKASTLALGKPIFSRGFAREIGPLIPFLTVSLPPMPNRRKLNQTFGFIIEEHTVVAASQAESRSRAA
jgi:hypothetical protein